jgi:hypothetical protein
VAGPTVVTAADMVAGHVVLDISRLDRLYLNGYVAKLQTPRGWCTSSTITGARRSCPRALFEPIGERFRRDIREWAQANGIPVIAFKAGQRKADVMARTWTLPPRPGGRRWWPSGAPRSSNWCGRSASATPTRAPHCPQFSFTKEQRRVSVFYVCILMSRSGRGSSRSAATSRIRSRCVR